jgi:copper chaperone CopZ
MRSFFCLATIGIVALAVNGYAQDSKKEPAKGEITKAMYWVPNQHCPDCAMALEGAMKKVGGIKSTTVSFPTKWATVEFDEGVISAQEVSRAMFQAPHAMGKDMKYGGFLLLSLSDAKDKATITKATTTLEKVEGVAKAVYYPQTKFVAIQFADKGKVTSTQLIKALDDAGLKASQAGAKK